MPPPPPAVQPEADAGRGTDAILSVVIPFYQREPGILRRCLASVAEQDLPAASQVRVIVLDDGSPVPARTDLAGLELPPWMTLRLIEQPNGGVAAARNRGLDAVSADSGFVAFLDSDDMWAPGHLRRAVEALDRGSGYDLYFCNHSRQDHHASYFELIGFDDVFSGGRHLRVLDRERQLFALDEDFAFSAFLRHGMAQTSTVVFRRDVAGDLRFSQILRRAGEDQLFWLHLVTRSPRVCFSREMLVECGGGVNIYFSQMSWDGPGFLERVADRLKSFDAICGEFRLGAADSAFVAGKVRQLRQQFAYLCFRSMVKRLGHAGPAIRRLSQDDPAFWRWFPGMSVTTVAARVLGRYKPLRE